MGETEALAPPAELQGLLVPAVWLEDFVGTAALVSQLDLVISVDTAVAHLAGALGRPCWLLLPDHQLYRRWLTDRTDTPWYPGVMRLFRQTRSGDAGGHWAPLLERVADELVPLGGLPSTQRISRRAWTASGCARQATRPALRRK